jgi:hypothetical protein
MRMLKISVRSIRGNKVFTKRKQIVTQSFTEKTQIYTEL